MKTGSYQNRRSLSIMLVFIMTITAFFMTFPSGAFAAGEDLTLYGYGVNYTGGGKPNAGWANSNLGNSWAEGEWVPYQLVIDLVDMNDPNGYAVQYDFYNANKDARFVDLVKGFQIKYTTETMKSKDKTEFRLQNTNMGWPHLLSPISTINEFEDAQSYNTNMASEVWSGFSYLNIDEEQINLGAPINPAVIVDKDDFNTLSPYDPVAHFLITKDDLENAGVPEDATMIVIYFQFHLSRTSLWSTGLFRGYSSPVVPAYEWGGKVYGEPQFEDVLMNGSFFYPGSSSHAKFIGATKTVPIPVPTQPLGSVSGMKFQDLDGDGEKDLNESGLANWPIYVSAEIDGMHFVLGTLTDANGMYSFPTLTYGDRYITEGKTRLDGSGDPEEGWVQTFPFSGFYLEDPFEGFDSYHDYFDDIFNDGNLLFTPPSITEDDVPIPIELSDYGYMVNINRSATQFSGRDFGNAMMELRISIGEDGVNEVGDEHEFTALVEVGLGEEWEPVPEGTEVLFEIVSGPGTLDPEDGIALTDENGEATISLNSSEPGITIVKASASVTMGSITLSEETDGLGENSEPAEKTWVDARISIEADGTNEVGDPHTFTAHVEINDGTGWMDAPDETEVDFATDLGTFGSLENPDEMTKTVAISGGGGEASVDLLSDIPGISEVTATVEITVLGVQLQRTTDGEGSNDDPGEKTWVDARISIGDDGVNLIGDPHTFTAHVEINDGTGWMDAPDGTEVEFVTDFGTFGDLLDPAEMTETVETVNGLATVDLVSDTPGVSEVSASVEITVEGIILERETDGTGGNSEPAEKTWVNARINIGDDGTNEVGDPHTFTAHVEINDGSGWADAPEGTEVVFSIESGPGEFDPISGVAYTDSNGEATIELVSDEPGITEVSAMSEIELGGVTIDIETDGEGENSGPAEKTWIDARISIGDDGVNLIGDPHTFTARVEINDGTGWVDAPDGTEVEFVTDFGTFGDLLDPAEMTKTVETTNGLATVDLISDTPGVSEVSASVEIDVLGITLDRETDGTGGNSEPAEKTWVNARISIGDDGTNEVGDPHTFTSHVEINDGSGWMDAPEDTEVTFSILSGPGELDPASGISYTDSNGEATIELVSDTPGITEVSAMAEIELGGVTIDIETDGEGENSGPAEKTWVDARISIGEDGTNMVGDPHMFTAHAEINDGTGWMDAPEDTMITFSIVSGPGALTPADGIAYTDANGEATIILNSAVAGTTIVKAAVEIDVEGVTLDRETDGIGGNSGPATKIWIAPEPDYETVMARMDDHPTNYDFKFSSHPWFSYVVFEEGDDFETFYVYSNKTRVGEVDVKRVGNMLHFAYRLDPGYELTETHINVQLSSTPQSNSFGLYPYKTLSFELEPEMFEHDLYLFIHGVVMVH